VCDVHGVLISRKLQLCSWAWQTVQVLFGWNWWKEHLWWRWNTHSRSVSRLFNLSASMSFVKLLYFVQDKAHSCELSDAS